VANPRQSEEDLVTMSLSELPNALQELTGAGEDGEALLISLARHNAKGSLPRRLLAINAMGDATGTAAVVALEDMLEEERDHGDKDLLSALIVALAKRVGSLESQVIAGFLSHRSSTVRIQALIELGLLGDKSVLEEMYGEWQREILRLTYGKRSRTFLYVATYIIRNWDWMSSDKRRSILSDVSRIFDENVSDEMKQWFERYWPAATHDSLREHPNRNPDVRDLDEWIDIHRQQGLLPLAKDDER
jgi:hypothetical protein